MLFFVAGRGGVSDRRERESGWVLGFRTVKV